MHNLTLLFTEMKFEGDSYSLFTYFILDLGGLVGYNLVNH